MNATEQFRQLVEQLAYYDHENDTDVVSQTVILVNDLVAEQATQAEAIDAFTGYAEALAEILDDAEQRTLVQSVFKQIPTLLFL